MRTSQINRITAETNISLSLNLDGKGKSQIASGCGFLDHMLILFARHAGFDPYERKLLGITAMQKLLGKARFDELLTAYIEKPQGKPTLVPESDKRPAMNTAKNDFMEENIDE